MTVPICVQSPKSIDLGAIVFQVAIPGTLDQLVPLPTKLLHIQPVIGKEVNVRLQSLCTYSEGTKAQLTLTHEGRTHFKDFTVTLGPTASLAAGKCLLRYPTFGPGGEAQSEIVVAGDHLDINLSGKVEGRETTARLNWSLPRVAGRRERRFRFLEPRRLSLDQKSITEFGSGRSVEPVHAAYPLHGEQRYQIVVHPQLPDVNEVKLHDIPGSIHVLNTEADTGRRTWTFLVDVSVMGRWSRPERLFYDVVTPHERLTGELHIHLKPPRWASGRPPYPPNRGCRLLFIAARKSSSVNNASTASLNSHMYSIWNHRGPRASSSSRRNSGVIRGHSLAVAGSWNGQ